MPPSAPARARAPAANVLFDGDCALCQGTRRFVQARDPHRRFRFIALQSAAGQRLLAVHHLPTDRFDSLVLIEAGAVSVRSTAVLHICRRLSAPWPLLYVGILLPTSWRDRLYAAIARRRR